jgi:cytoskeletal protein CcmA (bactofilin family)
MAVARHMASASPIARVGGATEGVIAECEIEGKHEGTLTAHQQLTLKRSAKVHGDVQYGQLSVEAGAQVTGSLHLATNVKDMKDRPKQAVSKTDKAPEASKERTA